MKILEILGRMSEKDADRLHEVGVTPGAIVSALLIIRHYRNGGKDKPINWWAKARGVHRTTWLRHLNLLSPFLQRVKSRGRFNKLSLMKIPLNAFRSMRELYKRHQIQRVQSRKKTPHYRSLDIKHAQMIVRRAMEYADCPQKSVETGLAAVAFLV